MKTKHILALLLSAVWMFSLAGCQGETGSAILSPDKAEKSFKAFVPTAVVNAVSPSPIDGVYEVVVENEDIKGIVYMSPDGRYILTGKLLDAEEMQDVTEERMYEVTKVDISQIALANSITMGAEDGPYKIVVFTDPLCSACALYHQELKKAVAINKQLSVYIKPFPLLDKSPQSYEKARSISCAKDNEEALRRLEAAFEGKNIPAPDCDGVIAGDNLAIALKLKVYRTPATIFGSGVKIMEAMSASRLLEEVNKRSGVVTEQQQ